MMNVQWLPRATRPHTTPRESSYFSTPIGAFFIVHSSIWKVGSPIVWSGMAGAAEEKNHSEQNWTMVFDSLKNLLEK